MEAVGEEFERLTGGYYYLYEPQRGSSESLRLRCELDDERVDVFSPPRLDRIGATSTIARRIVAQFDRRDRLPSVVWRDLPRMSLPELLAESAPLVRRSAGGIGRPGDAGAA